MTPISAALQWLFRSQIASLSTAQQAIPGTRGGIVEECVQKWNGEGLGLKQVPRSRTELEVKDLIEACHVATPFRLKGVGGEVAEEHLTSVPTPLAYGQLKT